MCYAHKIQNWGDAMPEWAKRIFDDRLADLHRQQRYRHFAEIERIAGRHPYARWHGGDGVREVILWCSNDYLGMGQSELVRDSMRDGLLEGGGAGGTRNIAGNSHALMELERELADLHGKERALVFSSGYVANDASLSTLISMLDGVKVFSDAGNHASMISGIRRAHADKVIFRHNDMAHLEELLKAEARGRPKMIVFESVYSMDGDIAPMGEIVALAKKYDALTYCDEVHGVGLYGAQGGGVAEAMGVADAIDVIQGTLGKAIGVMGGYIAGDAVLCDVVRSYGAGFIFTTALPPVLARGALASIRHLRQSESERLAQRRQVQQLKSKLQGAGFSVLPKESQGGESHIVPLMIGDAALCRAIADRLLHEHGMYIQPINYPTVPVGSERLRITPGPYHDDAMIDALLAALLEVVAYLNANEILLLRHRTG